MKHFVWNNVKNEQLKKDRNISFEIILHQIENKKVLAVEDHTNQDKYPNQRILIVEYENYAFMVPFVESETEIFLKTIIPSRKAIRKYLQSR
jgi:uncharacterized DUF497 family protein